MSYGENKKASLAYLGYATGSNYTDSNYTAQYTLASRTFAANGNFDQGYKVVYTSKEACLEDSTKQFTYTLDIGCNSDASKTVVLFAPNSPATC